MPDVTVTLRPGEIIVDSARTANLVREHRRLTRALDELHGLVDAARDVAEAVDEALRQTPEFDAIPPTVLVDSSWADARPACLVCGEEVDWPDALLMPCSTLGEDDEADTMGVIHRGACTLDIASSEEEV